MARRRPDNFDGSTSDNNHKIDPATKRRILKINDQIDSIQDVHLKKYTQNVDKRFRRLAEQQYKMISSVYDTLEKEEKVRARKSLQEQQESMKRSLDSWKKYSSRVGKDLSFTEKMATNLFYWNRRRDLRDLERESRYRFQDIAENAEEMADDVSDSFGKVAESLRDWGTAFNVNSLVNGMQEATESTRDIRIEINKLTSLTNEQWSTLKDNARQFSKDTGYAISNIEYLTNTKDIMINLGINDANLASEYAKYTTKLEKLTGASIEDMQGFLDATMHDGFNGAEDVRQAYSQAMALYKDDNFWNTSISDWSEAMKEHENAFYKLSKGNHDAYMNLINQSQALSASTETNWLSGVDELLYKIADGSYSQIGDSMAWSSIGAQQVAQLVQSGDMGGAYELLLTNLQGQLGSIYSSSGGNMQMINEWMQTLGMSDLELSDQVLTDLATNSEIIPQAMDTYNQAMSVILDQVESDQKFIDNWNPDTLLMDRWRNKWQSSWLGDKLDNTLNELDLSLGDILTGGGAVASIINLVKGKKSGGFLSGLFSKGKGSGAFSADELAKAFGTSTDDVLNTFGKQASYSLDDVAKSMGTTADDVLSLVGNSADDVLKGTSGALKGLNKAIPVIGTALSLGLGAYELSKADTAGAKGKAIGGTAGGIGGGLAGAAAGAAVGSVVPVIGTAIGGVIGGILGGLGGDWLGGKAGEAIGNKIDGSHKNGLNNVPYDGYIAELHQNEAVLTATEAERWRNANSAIGFFSNLYKNTNPSALMSIASGSSVSNAFSNVKLSGNSAQTIWKFLRDKGLSKEATAGLMGNLYAESGLIPNNLQDSYQGILGHSDVSYTNAIDNKTYGNFVHDSAGYGLAQWTYHSRKRNLLDYARNRGLSIGDLGMQLNFLWNELTGSYPGVHRALKSASSILSASNVVLHDFENPLNQSSSVEATRSNYGQQIYDEYNSYDRGTAWVPNDQVALIHKGEMIVPASANPINNGSTVNDDSTNDDIIQVLKWGFNKLESAIKSNSNSNNLANYARYKTRTDSEELFSFT